MARLFSKKNKFTDAELLMQFQKNGDMQVLGSLFTRYMDLVYGVCLKYLQDEGKAEDAVMGIFEELTKKARKHEVKDFRPWLYVLSKNYCLMELRRQKKEKIVSLEPQLMQSVDQRHHTIEQVDQTESDLKSMQDCMQQLPVLQKQCVELFYLENYSYKEIAETREIDLGKVRSYIQNGRRNLRICMEAKVEKHGGA